jgi:hypothetical protein
MFDVGACQKGGSMRSKSAVARPGGEEKPPFCPTGQRPLHAPGALALVAGPEPRSAAVMKPGLY